MAVELTQRCNSKLVAITDGSKATILSNREQVLIDKGVVNCNS